MKQYNLASKIYYFTDKADSKKSKGKQKKKATSNSCPRVDHGYLACQHHRVIITGLAWIEGFVTTGTIPGQFCTLYVCNLRLSCLKKNWKHVMIYIVLIDIYLCFIETSALEYPNISANGIKIISCFR